MSHVDDLIKQLCPDGVEFRPLNDLIDYEQPTKYLVESTAYDATYTTPVLTAGQTFILGYTDETDGIHPASVDEPVVIFDDFTTAFKWVDFEFKAKSSAMKMLTLKHGAPAILRYVYYAMLCIKFVPHSHARHWIGTYSNFRIPVPPLEVQREIVQILDHFVMLEAGLVAELEARKQQRHAFTRTLPEAPYIRALGSDVADHVRLGDVATQYVEPLRVQSGETYTNLGVKWYGEGALAREPKLGSAIKGTTLYRVKPGQFIYNRMFVTEGSFAVVTPELANGVVSNEFPVYDLDSSRVLPEWLMLYFQDEYTLKRIAAEVTGVERGSTKSRRRWKEEQFEAFQIELPSVPAQRELLRVLGTVATLESALRDELVARRKQYEYYRDRLLTFEELPT
jgi:hypothetical protein